MKLFIDSNCLSPYAMTAFVGLKEKGLPFEIALVDLQASEHRSTTYQAISSTERVPTLCDGDFNLSESSAICEYLDEAYPGPKLFPLDTKERAKAREIQAWLRSDFGALREERPTEVVFLKANPPPLSSSALAATEKLFRAADRLLAHNAQKLFGQWCIADTDLALMLNRLVLANDAVPDRLEVFAKHQWQRPSVQAWVHIHRPQDQTN